HAAHAAMVLAVYGGDHRGTAIVSVALLNAFHLCKDFLFFYTASQPGYSQLHQTPRPHSCMLTATKDELSGCMPQIRTKGQIDGRFGCVPTDGHADREAVLQRRGEALRRCGRS